MLRLSGTVALLRRWISLSRWEWLLKISRHTCSRLAEHLFSVPADSEALTSKLTTLTQRISGWIWIMCGSTMWNPLLGLSDYDDYTLHCRKRCSLFISIFFPVRWVFLLLFPTWISLEMIPTVNRRHLPLSSFQKFRLQTPLSRAYQKYCTFTSGSPIPEQPPVIKGNGMYIFPGSMLSYLYRLHSPLFACMFRAETQCDSFSYLASNW